MAGEELVAKYQTIIFLAGSASAEFFADMALSPFEAVKVRAALCRAVLLLSSVCSGLLSCGRTGVPCCALC
jgi:hypothetical protein